MARAVEAWFTSAARDLPWRDAPPGRRDPYRVLVAEAMLQQTQVSRVIPKYTAFLDRFPTIERLARAGEHEVLALWSGLGYYRRARNLHAAAKVVVEHFAGRVPGSVEALRHLPGVGRYTAGAIASIALGRREPIVDGNVARVLLRLDGIEARASDKGVLDGLWTRATELVKSARRPGAVNEGLMELGATVCTPPPGKPACAMCPLRRCCLASARRLTERIPLPKAAPIRRALFCTAVVLFDVDGAILLEQREAAGMWGGLWQAPTLESPDRHATAAQVRLAVGLGRAPLHDAGGFTFVTTHRDVRFSVWTGRARDPTAAKRGRWFDRARLEQLGMGAAQRMVLSLACEAALTGRACRDRTRTTG